MTVHAKVLRIQPATDVSSNLKKQEVTVADATGAIKVTLWEKSIDLLEEDKSYELKNFTVRMYKHEKYLSIPKEGYEIKQIEDIADVVEDDLPDNSTTISNVKILGASINLYSECVACNSKVAPSADSGISKCTKCDLEQLTTSCSNQTSATLHVVTGGQHFTHCIY